MEISSQEKLLLAVAKILDDLKIEYFITGSFAVSVWGRPRATFDIDIVVKIAAADAEKLTLAWKRIVSEGYADCKSVKDAIASESEFNFIDPDSGIKIDFWVSKKNEKDGLEFKNKKAKKIGGQLVYFISPEDLIISKLQWYKISPSSRHIEDVESVLKISGDILDKNYLNLWIEKLGLEIPKNNH